jgi:hypothetical protein
LPNGSEPGTAPNPADNADGLAALNTAVTAAIFRAEHLPEGSMDAMDAFYEVYVLESSIAKKTSWNSLDGVVARCGTVTAALSAGQPEAAFEALMVHLVELGYRREVVREVLSKSMSARLIANSGT